jgi:hypothetical protein
MKSIEHAVGRINTAMEPVLMPLLRSSVVIPFFKRHLSCSWTEPTETQQVVCGTDQMSVQLHVRIPVMVTGVSDLS